jgi:hypothetical protein
MIQKLKFFALTLAFAGILSSCENDPPLPDIEAAFEAELLGFEGTDKAFKVTLTRASDEDISLLVVLRPSKVIYGTHFTTNPAATSDQLTVVIPAGSTEAVIAVNKPADVFLNGDESIEFELQPPAEPTILAEEKTSLTLTFGAITSEGSSITAIGKTGASQEEAYTNAVYMDLSANSATSVNRKSWNLGFISGTDFKVVLNPGYQTTAAALAKSDINAVVLADAEDIQNLSHDMTDPETLPLADHWTGDLTKTTFGNISATDSENKVFLVSFEGNKATDQWFKVKVTRNGEAYKVQYARIGETTIKSLDVPKKADYNMTFVSLENNAIVDVEPVKQNWDIQWAYSTSNSGLNTPYWFQDFILLNYLGGAEAAELTSTGGVDAAANVAAATAAYTAFGEANIAGTTFLKTRDVIGSKWRSTAPGSTTGIKRDRFYVIKDPRGNYYKLKFVSMGLGGDGGERGKPVIEYKLVKKTS